MRLWPVVVCGVACASAKGDPEPLLDTALPSALPSTTTPAGTGSGSSETDWYTDGAYTGPLEVLSVHQSCEGGEWRYIVEARGSDHALTIQQWILGIPPEERPDEPGDYAGHADIDGTGNLDWEYISGHITWVYDWPGSILDLEPRPSCATDVHSDRIVVAFHLQGSIPWNEGDKRCVMFGPDAENLRADPKHYRAFEEREYLIGASSYDYSTCQIIPWPTGVIFDPVKTMIKLRGA